MINDLTISEARSRLSSLPEELAQGPEALTVTRRGKPVLAILPWEAYEALIETMEILGDEELMAQLRQGIEDVKAGRMRSLEDIRKELDL